MKLKGNPNFQSLQHLLQRKYSNGVVVVVVISSFFGMTISAMTVLKVYRWTRFSDSLLESNTAIQIALIIKNILFHKHFLHSEIPV